MAIRIKKKQQVTKNFIPTFAIGQEINKWVKKYELQRKGFERRWYDNNFFDDGFHYRYVSRTTGRIVDLTSESDLFVPKRAIPKASRQIRGVANLILANDPTPVVYPEKITNVNYPQPEQFQQALQVAKDHAKKIGIWVERKWEDLMLKELLTYMVILAAKHGVSYIEVWPDAVEEECRAKVYDAFDWYLNGALQEVTECPHIVKAVPQYIAEIKANELYEEEAKEKLNPDNKYASSEIKEAYMRARFGARHEDDASVSVILQEAFIREYLNDENWSQAVKQADETGAMEGKSKGDPIIRQVFATSGVTLRDKYVNLPDYPVVDFRFEPGPIYQVPLIERFIPANKSLDSVASRTERHIGTMISGTWLRRRGENFDINNIAGGQVIDYETTPPVQAQHSPIPNHVFNFMSFLEKVIEEQGSSTSALGQVPQGVKSGVAIESLKATEYANLKIPVNQVKKTVKGITEKVIDIASNHFISPQTVYLLEEGEPTYFDIIGQKGMEKYQELSKGKGSTVNVPNAIPIKKDYKVDIEIESGLGFTEEGKRNTMLQIIQFIRDLAREGYVSQEAVALVIKKFLEVFQFGSLQEFMEAMDTGTMPITDRQIQEMKVALLEVIKDLQQSQQPQQPAGGTQPQAPATSQDEDVLKVKTGFMEGIRDLQQSQGGGQ